MIVRTFHIIKKKSIEIINLEYATPHVGKNNELINAININLNTPRNIHELQKNHSIQIKEKNS